MKNLESKKAFEKYIKDIRNEALSLTNDEIKNIILAERKRNGIQTTEVTEEEINKKRQYILDMIDLKYDHSFEVPNDAKKVAIDLKFKGEIPEFIELNGMVHDTGRFAQTLKLGNQVDSILSSVYPGIKDHGELGRMILEKGLIQTIVPYTRSMDTAITTIVGEHVKGLLPPPLDMEIKDLRIFSNFDLSEIIRNEEFCNQLMAMTTRIIQDVDRIDIYHQILKPTKAWKPLISSEPIDPVVFDMFFKGEYLDMANLRARGLWNANVGELVRLGFINNLKLVSTARVIEQEALIRKMYELRNIEERSQEMPLLKEAFYFAEYQLANMIANSVDNINLDSAPKRK